jgi:micrococcal nuclease
MRGLIVGLLIAAAAAVPAFSSQVEGHAYVRDGDTIVVGGTPVRLNGVDAPELDHRYGYEARQLMQQIVRGRTVTCQLNGERTGDRWVGICYVNLDGQVADVGAVLIANGFALDCRRYSGGRYRSLELADARSYLRQAGYC